MIKFEIIFAFDKNYLKALEKLGKTKVLEQRVCMLVDILRIPLHQYIRADIEQEFEKYKKESREVRSLDFENDIEFWYYVEKLIFNGKQSGPIYSSSNTIVAKCHIYFRYIDEKVFSDLSAPVRLLSLIRKNITKALKTFNENTLIEDLYNHNRCLNDEEFGIVKEVFKCVIMNNI